MIELRGVSKRFGEQIILDGVDFTVQDLFLQIYYVPGAQLW